MKFLLAAGAILFWVVFVLAVWFAALWLMDSLYDFSDPCRINSSEDRPSRPYEHQS